MEHEDRTVDVPLGPIPERLGPCRLLKTIGRGGAGTVYLAEMAEDRPYAEREARVAVKVLHPELLQGTSALRRFLREGKLGTALHHPAVVRTFEGDAVSLGDTMYHFLVLEYVEGELLGSVMESLCLVPEALLRDLGAQIARGLEAIHGSGAIHRDLKPANIAITPDDQVKLMDLGIARLVEEAGGPTLSGDFVGSPSYAAPEQFEGGELSPSADLYALGVILYEGATGSNPFSARSVGEVMRRQLDHIPRPAGEANPQITPFLEEVLACLLEKKPDGRFASAGEVAEVLERGEKSDWWCNRERRLRDRHPRRKLRPIRILRETKFIGRERELEALWSQYREIREGCGRIALIEGEAGIGKTRLMEEFLEDLEARETDALVLYGSCSPGGLAGRAGALGEAVLDHFGAQDLEARLASQLRSVPRLVKSFASLLLGAQTLGEEPPLSSESLATLFCELARGLATDRRVIWILEDFQSATAHERALLISLARVVGPLSLLLVVTYRPGFTGEDLDRLHSTLPTTHLLLERLPASAVESLVGEAIGSMSLAIDLGPAVHRKTDGNPYFVLEMIRDLRAKAVTPNGLTGEERVSNLETPRPLADRVMRRVEALGEGLRPILDVAAVQGFTFEADLLARALHRSRLDVLQALAYAERRARVVRAVGTTFCFDHHLLQESLYESLPPALRREYHALLARAYREQNGLAASELGEISGEAAFILARHSLLGSDNTAGLELITEAQNHLWWSYQNEEFLQLTELAMNALGGDETSQRARLLLRQADCLDRLGRLNEKHSAVEEAMRCAQSAGDLDLEAKALMSKGALLTSLGDYREARRMLEGVLPKAREAGNRMLEGKIYSQLARVCMLTTSVDDARRYAEGFVGISKLLGAPALEARAMGELGHILQIQGLYDEALGYCEEQLAYACRKGDLEGEANARGRLGYIFCDVGKLSEARRNFERSLECAQEAGKRPAALSPSLYLAHICLLEGRLDEAAVRLGKALELCRALASIDGEAFTSFHQGDLEYASGDRGQALALYERAIELGTAVGSRAAVAEGTIRMGRLLAEMDREMEARPYLHEAAQLVEELDLPDPGPLPAAYLALLGDVDPDGIQVPTKVPVPARAETHLVLHRAGASGGHLASARRLLEEMSNHLDGEDRTAFWRNNPVARQVLDETDRQESTGR